MKAFHLKLFFLLLVCFTASSQTIPCLQYGVEDGLGNSLVYDVFQDSKGYMWFSTDHGLSKFDGQHFTNYTTADGLPTNFILTATQTSDGAIWLGTFGYGLCKYAKGKFVSVHTDKPGAPMYITSVLADKEDRVWLFARNREDNNIWFVKNNDFQKFSLNTYTKDTISYIVYSVFIRSDSAVLFATNKGLYALKKNKLTCLLNPDVAVYSIDEDYSGNLWLGTDGKIIELSANNGIRTVTNDQIKEERVNSIKADYEGRLWLSQFPHRLLVIDAGTGKKIFQKDNVPVDILYMDRERNMWSVTFGEGVFCFNYPDIMNYSIKDGLADNIIESVSEDSKGKLWIASLRGISYLVGTGQEGAITTIKQNEIFGFAVVNNDELVYGCSGVLTTIKNEVKKNIPIKGRIRSLYKDGTGKVWLAMEGGVSYYQNGSVFDMPELSSLDGKKNYAVIVDSKGQLWSATNDGVYCYTGKTLIHYTTQNGLSNNTVNGLWEDNNNRIWFATNEGISILDKGKWITDSLLAGLNNIMCNCFIGDRNNHIWIGTNNGLFIYDGKKLVKLDNHTGLAGIEIQSLFLDTKNQLWVSTIKGLSRIDLNMYSYIVSSHPPQIYIQSVRINNSLFHDFDSLSPYLDHSSNNIRISYVGLCFKDPQSLSYEYKLSGTSDTWIKTTGTSVEFSSLSPGAYKFLVRAMNNDEVYSTTPAYFAFVILPPFWMRPWFILLEIILGIIVLSILFRWRLKIQKRKALLHEELINAKKTLQEYTGSMVEKNELLEQFKADMDKLKDEVDKAKMEQLEHLNKVSILTEEDWNKFKRLFEGVYKGYFTRLKEKLPDLTQAEIRLVCLTKLGIGTKQMAGILGVSFDTIKQTRWRLRKKMGLTEEDSIDDIASSI